MPSAPAKLATSPRFKTCRSSLNPPVSFLADSDVVALTASVWQYDAQLLISLASNALASPARAVEKSDTLAELFAEGPAKIVFKTVKSGELKFERRDKAVPLEVATAGAVAQAEELEELVKAAEEADAAEEEEVIGVIIGHVSLRGLFAHAAF